MRYPCDPTEKSARVLRQIVSSFFEATSNCQNPLLGIVQIPFIYFIIFFLDPSTGQELEDKKKTKNKAQGGIEHG